MNNDVTTRDVCPTASMRPFDDGLAGATSTSADSQPCIDNSHLRNYSHVYHQLPWAPYGPFDSVAAGASSQSADVQTCSVYDSGAHFGHTYSF